MAAALAVTQISVSSVFAQSDVTEVQAETAGTDFTDNAAADSDAEGTLESSDIIADISADETDESGEDFQEEAEVSEETADISTDNFVADFVSDEDVADAAGAAAEVDLWDGESGTDNISQNSYWVWSSTSGSYLADRGNGVLERIQYVPDKGVVVEKYQNGVRQSSQVIAMELSLFGGFYNGTNYNFLVFGQENTSESDSCEVIRIVRYSRNWERQAVCSIYGANTYIPFDAGSLDMTENGSTLYLHTCHEMYQTSDGYHHQANMTFVVDEEKMKVSDSWYQIMNVSYGYVSHSFSQYIQTDGNYVYRVDHGDAYPRGIVVTKASVNGRITNVDYTVPMYFQGQTGANATGASVGGFELSSDTCVIAGNSVDQSSESTWEDSEQRNIFVISVTKNLRSSQVHWLTSYQESDGITVCTPQIIKTGSDRFLVLWEEYDEKTETYTTKMAAVNASGEAVSQVVSTYLSLSDCQPILTSDGQVQWYVAYNGKTYFCSVDPNDLDSVSAADTAVIRDRLWKDGTVQNLKAAYVENYDSYMEDGSYGYVTLTWNAVSGAEYYEVKEQDEEYGYYSVYRTEGSQNQYRIYVEDINAPLEASVRACKDGYRGPWVKVSHTGWSEKTPKLLSGCRIVLSTSYYTADGKAKKPSVKVYDQNKLLKAGTDYVVSGYKNNIDPGTASVVVKGTGKYTGTSEGSFRIGRGSQKKQTITASSVTKTASSKSQTFSLGARALGGAKLSYKSSTNKVSVTSAGRVTVAAKFTGKAVITITARETYAYKTAVKKITVTVKPQKPSITKLASSAKGKFTVNWKRDTAVTGYQVQYSLSSGFNKNVKTVTVSGSSATKLTRSGLSGGKTYYVRIRSYKKVSGGFLYSGWSTAKKVKVKK